MERKKKIYASAPLPFMGQKRKFLKQFKPALEGYPPNATMNATINYNSSYTDIMLYKNE